MNYITYKNNSKIIGSIIKFNRIKQNLSQKNLSKGICVPSYLSRIENGELIPSEDLISLVFKRLGLTFNDSEEFINKGIELFELLFDKLNYNEFDYTNRIFEEIENNEISYMTSPLIIEYLLAKLARYCSTPDRDKFETSKNMLFSSFELLSPYQKFLYKFYVGIDTLNISQDKLLGKKLIEEAVKYKETGHCYFWLSYAYRIENNTIKAYDCINKALNLYVAEGNIISIMATYEKFAEVYFLLDNYSDAIHYLKMALNIATKFNNKHFIEHINSQLAWTHYRLKDYTTALKYLNNNTGIIDHRMSIPDSVIECLIYFESNNKDSLKNSLTKLYKPESLEQIGNELTKILYDFFNYYIENTDYMKSHIWEGLLLYIIDDIHKLVELKKVFNTLLKEYYIYNRRYKDALYI